MHRAPKPTRAIFRALLRWQEYFAVLALTSTLLSPVLVLPLPAYAAAGVPRIINNQGRLMDANGSLLGGAGTDYCFKFSLFDNAGVGSGSQVWPATAPSVMTVPVKQGIYSVGVGDTDQGGDVLDYNFQDNDAVYLNVEVAAKVGATCAAGDGAESFENLSPRQRIFASGYAVNAATVGGFTPAQQATGNQIPVLSAGNLILAASNPFINATSTNALTLQGGGSVSGDIRFFNAGNKLTSAGNLTLTGSVTASGLSSFTNLLIGGLSTTTIQGSTSGTSTIQGFLNVLGTNSTSTFSGPIATPFLNLTGAGATSTAASGFDIAAGCFSIGGVCVGGVNSITANADNTLVVDPTGGNVIVGLNLSNANVWTGLQQFANASSSIFSAGKAFFGATATTTIDSAGNVDVAGTLDVSGNTTLAKATSTSFAITSVTNTLLKTDANGSVVPAVPGSDYLVSAVTSLGAAGQGQTGATQTFATSTTVTNGLTAAITVTSSGNVHTFTPSVTGTLTALGGGTGIANPSAGGILIGSYAGGAYQQIATSSLGIRTTDVQEGSNLYYQDARVNAFIDASTTIPKTFSANIFSGLTTLNGGLTVGSLNGPLQANNGVVSATSSIGVAYGGTGISTAPAFGQLLVGNAVSGYSLVATSTLAIALNDTSGTLAVNRGGTGITSPTAGAIVLGDYSGTGYMQVATSSLGLLTTNVAEGSNLYYQNARVLTYLDSFDKGYFYSTTSADYWKSQNDFYSTTSADYWKSQNNFFSTSSNDFWKSQTNFYSTTSADYWKSQNSFFSTTSSSYFLSQNLGSAFSTTSATYFADASSTIAKTYSNNTFTGSNSFAAVSVTGSTTLANVTAQNATTTNATSTTLYTGTITAGNATVADLSATGNSSFANATATSLFSRALAAVSTAFGGTATSSFGSNGELTLAGGLNGPLQAVNGLVSATSTLSVSYGGTGLTTAPSFGQILLGNSTGGYGLVATSTLGISLSDTTGTLPVARGGTGLTTVTANQLLVGGPGNTVVQIATSSLGLLTTDVQEGTNLYYQNARVLSYLNSFDKGYFYSTTSADYWKSQNTFFSTSSVDFWKTQNNFFSTTSATYFAAQGLAFSTTSSQYFLSQNQGAAFSTTSAMYFADASSTITKSYSNNTFTGSNTFNGDTTLTNATTASLAVTGVTSSLLKTNANGSVVPAVAGVDYAAANASTFGQSFEIGADGYLAPTTSLIVRLPSGFVSQASSTVGGNLTVMGNLTAANATVTNATSTSFFASILAATTGTLANIFGTNATITNATATNSFAATASSTQGFFTRLITGNATSTGQFAAANLSVSGSTTLQNVSAVNATTTNATTTGSAYIASLSLGTALTASNGGTGISAPTAAGILLGNYAGTGYQQLATSSLGLSTTDITEGTNLYYQNARVLSYLDTFNKGYFYSTTSTDYWKTQNNFFSTTSADAWKLVSNFFSTTSSQYFLSQNQGAAFSTTSAMYFADASSTIAKTYSNNTFTGANVFNGNTTTTSFAITSVPAAILKTDANGSVIPAIAGVDYLTGSLYGKSFEIDASGYLAPTTSVTVRLPSGFVSQASSTVDGNLTVTGNLTAGNATVTNATTTSLFASVASSTNAFFTRLVTGNATATGAFAAANLTVTGSSTLQNVTAQNATTTNATSTSFFAGVLAATSGTIANIFGINATITAATTTNLFATTASTTNLFASNLTFAGGQGTTSALAITGIVNGLLGTNANGSISATSFSGPLSFSGNTLTITQANGATSGFLASSDWNVFNNKVSSTSLDTSAELATLITDETGSGSLVFGTAPLITDGRFASTTLSGNVLITGNATGTNATTTTFYSTTASSTNLFTSNLSIGNLNGLLKSTNGIVAAAIAGTDYISSAFRDWNVVNGVLVPTTTIGVIVSASSTFAGGLTMSNATATNATTTSLFASIASSTNTFATRLFIGNGTSTGVFATNGLIVNSSSSLANFTGNNATVTNATSSSFFSSILYAFNGRIGDLIASTSATLASTTAYGRFITGNVVATSSTGTSTFSGAVGVGTTNPSYKVSIVGSTTAATSATGTAVLSVTNTNNTLSSGTNVLRLNIRTPFGTACTSGTTCPRFIEYVSGMANGSDTGGAGVGSLRLSTAGTGITQTSGAADFAEFMQLNSSADVGDLVSLNSSGQYQKAVAGQSLIGVISDNPAFVGNATIEGQPNAYVVGFAGVIQTTVSAENGSINAGDLIAATTTPGLGVKLTKSGYALGQALESYSGPGNGTIKVLVMPKYVDAAIVLDSYGGTTGGTSGYWSLATSTGEVSLASSTYSLLISGKLTAANASTTNFSSTYASSTRAFVGALSVGDLNGVLRATGGLVSTALVNLASDVTGTLQVANGGTNISTPTAAGVLVGNYTGDGYMQVATSSLGLTTTNVAEGSNLYYQNARVLSYLNTLDKGYFFATTSADFWKTQNNFFSTTSVDAWKLVSNFFSTTSTDYWKSQNDFFSTTSTSYFTSQGLAFSTTSSQYFLSQNQGAAFSTTSATYFADASSTIVKTYSNNTFAGSNAFNGDTTLGKATSSSFAVTGISSALVKANANGSFVPAIPGVDYAAANASTFGQTFEIGADGYLAPTTSVTVRLPSGFVSQASSTVDGNLTVTGNVTAANATVTNATTTSFFASVASSTQGFFTRLITGNATSTGQFAAANLSITGSTTLQNVSAVNATTTNATTTGSAYIANLSLGSALTASNGGTGISTPTAAGILLGNYAGTGYQQLATSSLGLSTTDITEGTNLYYQNARVLTYLDTFNKGYFYSTTSTDYWKTQNNFFSTTSADAWKLVSNFFSTTSSQYFLSQNQGAAFSTTSATYFADASTTIAKTYSNNTFTGSNIFNGNTTFGRATTTSFAITSVPAAILKTDANGSVIPAIAGVDYLTGSLYGKSFEIDASGYLAPTTSVTVRLPSGFVSQASSTVDGNLTVTGNLTAGNATVTNATTTSLFASIASSTSAFATRLFVGNATATGVFASNGLMVSGSTTLQNFSGNNATATSLYAVSASTTNLYASNGTIVRSTTTNATSTTSFANTASSTNLFASNFSLGNLTGILKATAGAVSTALVNLATDVTGILQVANGGTGWAAVQAGSLLYGNGSGSLATTTQGSAGQMLAFLNGVPTWVATTTFSNGLTYANGNVTLSSQVALTNASSTALSANDYLSVGRTATTTIRGETNATSTFAGGIQAAALELTGGATSSAAGGFNLTAGCFSVNGTCLGNAQPGTNVVLTAVRRYTATQQWTVPSNLVYAVVEVWGGGGGGGDGDGAGDGTGGGGAGGYASKSYIATALVGTSSIQALVGAGGATTTSASGSTGGTSNFGGFATSTGGAGGVRANAGEGAGGAGGVGSGGDINLSGEPGGLGDTTMANQQGNGGSAPRGGNGGRGGSQTTGNGEVGGACGGGGGGAGGAAGGGGSGCVVIYEYTATNVALGNGSVNSGSTGQVAYYDSAGQAISGSSILYIDSVNGRVGVGSTTPAAALGVSGDAFINGRVTTAHLTATGTLSVNGSTTLQNFTAGNSTTTNSTSTNLFATTASSTNLFASNFTLGGLTGILKATAGLVAVSLVDLTSDITGILQVANGGTGWDNLVAGTLLTGNGSGKVATTTIGSSLQISGSSLGLNLSNPNIWTGLQTFTNASTTFVSVLTKASFGSTATTTIDSAGNVAVAGNLNVAGITLLGQATTTNLLVTASTTLQNFTGLNSTTTNATSTTLFVNTASTTNLFASNGTIARSTTTNATTTTLFANTASTTNLFASYATTSNLYVTGPATSTLTAGLSTAYLNVTGTAATSTFARGIDLGAGCFSVAGVCIGASSGSSFGFPFTTGTFGAATANATSTLLGFTAGFYSLASSTIGNGTQIGGLTIAGGATTTGNLLVQGNATSSAFFATTASSTNLFTSNLSINTFNGILKSTNGAVSTAVAGSDYISTAFKDWNVVNGVLVPTTTVGIIVSASSTFAGGLTTSNATATNATTTSIFATIASSTNLYASNVFLTNGTITRSTSTNATSTNFFASNASTTNLVFSGGQGTTSALFAGTSSSTNAYATSLLVGNATSTGTIAANNLSLTGSTTLQNFAGVNSTTTNATSTNLFATIASSTNLFASNFSLGSVSGFLKATAGVVASSLVNLTSDITGILQVANGGTGWDNLVAGTLLTGNGSGKVATTTIGSSLQISGSSLGLNLSNPNIWTGLQTFTNASTTFVSVLTKASFGSTATTTIDSAGNVAVAGTLSVTGNTTLAAATTSNLLVTGSTTLQNFTARNATTTQATTTTLYISSALRGAGLSACANSTDKLLWDTVTGQFSCGVDAGAGAGIANLGAAGQLQNGTTQTFATSTDTNIGLTITSLANVHTFTTIWNGILSVARGGTGWANIQAGTLLTGNGSGAVATTTIGGSLQISGSSLGLNLANANVWTGLQTFKNASTTLLESITQFAQTIQSTSTNALALKSNLSSTAGLTLGGTTTPQILAIDTQNTRVKIGTGGASPVLFVLDTKNTAGDPTGVDGAQYYNSNTSDYRCFSGTTWRSCGGLAASSTGDVQFKNVDGSFTATSNFNWSMANNGLTITASSSSQTTDLFTIASSTGASMFAISSKGVIELASTSDPATPASGLNIYAKDIAGRIVPKWIGPSGVDTSFQASLGFNKIAMVSSAGATLTAVATALTNVGTLSAATLATTNLKTSVRRTTLTSAAAAGSLASSRATALMVTRGNAAGIGGFFYTARFGLTTLQAGNRGFFGLTDVVTAPANTNPTTNTTPGKVGLAFNANTGNWKFVWNVTGTAPTVADLGTSFPINNTDLLELVMFSKPNDTAIAWRLTNLTSGAQISSTTPATNIPSNTTFLTPVEWMTNNATAVAVAFDLVGWYLESDN